MLVEFGWAPEAIRERAGNDFDLIVPGGRTAAHPSSTARKFGEVTRKVVAAAPCAVLSVPEAVKQPVTSVTPVTSATAA